MIYILLLLASITLHADSDESKAITQYIQKHLKTPSTPLPDKLKTKVADITLLEDFVRNNTLSLDKIPPTILEKCKDTVFRETLLQLVSQLKIKIVSDDKTIESIIQKFNEQDVYTYLSAKIDIMLANNDAFNATIKSASPEVKNFILLDLLLTTASEFGTIKEYQKSDDFKKNERFIKYTIDAGAKINDAISKLSTLGLTVSELENFINALFAPHFDFIDFLLKNGLDKNLQLPTTKKPLVEFYENLLNDATTKLAKVVSTDLKNTQEEIKKIIAQLKTSPPSPAQTPA